jgi:4-hydroxy-3-polyprenylbenzoate decarboxylase
MQNLSNIGVEIHLIVTRSGGIVFEQELGFSVGKNHEETYKIIKDKLSIKDGMLFCYNPQNPGATVASGSARNDGMVIVPCSMSMLAAVSTGLASDLTARAASVMLKERRPLVVVPRETPLNGIHLKNMLTLHEAGAIILPAMPGFYNHPKSIDDIADFIVGRILDILRIENTVYRRWEGMELKAQ